MYKLLYADSMYIFLYIIHIFIYTVKPRHGGPRHNGFKYNPFFLLVKNICHNGFY